MSYKSVVINKPKSNDDSTTIFTYYKGDTPIKCITVNNAEDEWMRFKEAKASGYLVFLSRSLSDYKTIYDKNADIKPTRMGTLMSV